MSTTPPGVPGEASPYSLAGIRKRIRAIWGLLPFLVFIALFLLSPILMNIWKTFVGPDGFTLKYVAQIFEPQYLGAFSYSLRLSLVVAAIAGVLGTILAWVLISVERPRWLYRLVDSFTIVASRSGGVTLAFAYVAAFGTQGVVTVILRNATGLELRDFLALSSFNGLVFVYLYFQIPLMTVLMLPALQGVRKEWREAAESLGAGRIRYLLNIALPILSPAIVGALIVVFADSLQAYATAYALARDSANLVTIVIGFLLSGNVFTDPNLAAALVTGMMLIIAVAMAIRSLLLRRSTRWQR